MGRGDTKGLVGVFLDAGRCADAAREMKSSGRARIEVYSPVPSHEIQEALGIRKSPLGWLTLAAALAGAVGGTALAAHAALSFDLIVSGKPVVSWLAWILMGMECAILLGALANFFGMLLLSGLPRLKRAPGYEERFSVDAFGLFVPCPAGEAEQVRAQLQARGAEEIHEHF
jgi:hypothetical protein